MSTKLLFYEKEKTLIECYCFFLQKALAQANVAKLEGNKLFGEGQFEEALSKYELALQMAPDMPSSDEVRSICHSNRAVCFMKLVCTLFSIQIVAIMSIFLYYDLLHRLTQCSTF